MTHETRGALPTPAEAAPTERGVQWQRRRDDHGDAQPAPPPRTPLQTSDADKYRWLRANRGNFAIATALNHSDRDVDFDAQIEAAIRMSMAGRHYYCSLDDLPR